jgi:flagellar motor switch protein FliN/FliY
MAETPNVNEITSCENATEELHHFLDVPVKVGIQLAKRNMKVHEILQLQPNSVVELPKSAGENVDILVNGRLIAFGEVLELEGSTGIRLTDFNMQL